MEKFKIQISYFRETSISKRQYCAASEPALKVEGCNFTEVWDLKIEDFISFASRIPLQALALESSCQTLSLLAIL
jgi:hypothetical protein